MPSVINFRGDRWSRVGLGDRAGPGDRGRQCGEHHAEANGAIHEIGGRKPPGKIVFPGTRSHDHGDFDQATEATSGQPSILDKQIHPIPAPPQLL